LLDIIEACESECIAYMNQSMSLAAWSGCDHSVACLCDCVLYSSHIACLQQLVTQTAHHDGIFPVVASRCLVVNTSAKYIGGGIVFMHVCLFVGLSVSLFIHSFICYDLFYFSKNFKLDFMEFGTDVQDHKTKKRLTFEK